MCRRRSSNARMDWTLVAKALCLVAVIEGLAYALAPRGMREAASMVSRMSASSLRSAGVATMAVGALLLFLISR